MKNIMKNINKTQYKISLVILLLNFIDFNKIPNSENNS